MVAREAQGAPFFYSSIYCQASAVCVQPNGKNLRGLSFLALFLVSFFVSPTFELKNTVVEACSAYP